MIKQVKKVKRKFSQGLQLFALVAKEPSIAVHQAKVEASGHLSFRPDNIFSLFSSVANEDPAMPSTVDKTFRCYSTKMDMGRSLEEILQGDWRLISECSRDPRFFSPLRPHAVHRSCASCLLTVFSTSSWYSFTVYSGA
jgi:hypothetical protein